MISRAWKKLWFPPRGPENLCLSRMLVSGLFLWSHLSWDLSVWTEVSDAFWMPIPLFRTLGLDIPSAAVIRLLQNVFLVSLTLGFLGLFTRTAFAVSCFTWLYVFGMRQSFGSIAPAEGHFIIMFGIFAMSRCGDAFSLDSLIRRWRDRPDPIPEEAQRGSYSWPVRLVQFLFVSVFFASGVAKLRLGGLDWILSDNLALTVQVIDLGPLSHWIAGKVLLGQFLGAAAVTLELLSVLAFFSWRARIVIVPSLLLLQVGFAVTMRALFQTFFLTYAFWIPWDRLLDMARGERSRGRTRARLALAALLATFVGWTSVLPWVLR